MMTDCIWGFHTRRQQNVGIFLPLSPLCPQNLCYSSANLVPFLCGRHLWKPPKFGNPFLPSTANSRCFSEWRIIMTRLAAVHKAATKSLLTGEGKHWDWGQDWASLSGTLGTSLLSPLKCTLNNSMKKGTLCFAPSVMGYSHTFAAHCCRSGRKLDLSSQRQFQCHMNRHGMGFQKK